MSAEARLNLPFTGIASFCKYPIVQDLGSLDADVAVVGVPYDMGTQYRPGARFGPRGIRDASTLYSFGLEGSYDPERDEMFLGPEWRIVDCGDVDMVHGDLTQCFRNIRATLEAVLDRGAMPVLLGGDHSVTIPALEAYSGRGPVTLVQIDAHLDFADERSGQRYGHGSPIRRASEMDHVSGIAQLGIRGIGSSKREDFEDARRYGSVIVSPLQLRQMGIEETLNQIPSGDPYYVTIDCDGLDPSIAPGTGTPSPGGFHYEETRELLEGLARKGDVVGFEFVEVAPIYDPTGLTSQVASRVILDFIGFILKERERKARTAAAETSVANTGIRDAND